MKTKYILISNNGISVLDAAEDDLPIKSTDGPIFDLQIWAKSLILIKTCFFNSGNNNGMLLDPNFTVSLQAVQVALPPIKNMAVSHVMLAANHDTFKGFVVWLGEPAPPAYKLCCAVSNYYFLSIIYVCLPDFNITGKILIVTESSSLRDDAGSGLHQGTQFEQIDSLK